MRKNTGIKWDGNKTEVIERKTNGKSPEVRTAVNQLQRIAANIAGVLLEFEINKDGSIAYTYMSPAFETVFGFKPTALFKLTQFLHPEDLDSLHASLNTAAASCTSFYNESKLIVPGRGLVWRSLNCAFSHYSKMAPRYLQV